MVSFGLSPARSRKAHLPRPVDPDPFCCTRGSEASTRRCGVKYGGMPNPRTKGALTHRLPVLPFRRIDQGRVNPLTPHANPANHLQRHHCCPPLPDRPGRLAQPWGWADGEREFRCHRAIFCRGDLGPQQHGLPDLLGPEHRGPSCLHGSPDLRTGSLRPTGGRSPGALSRSHDRRHAVDLRLPFRERSMDHRRLRREGWSGVRRPRRQRLRLGRTRALP